MKRLSLSGVLLVAGLIGLTFALARGRESSGAAAFASPPQAMAGTTRGPNERFYTVQSKLDEGGSFYLYADLKGVAQSGVAKLKLLLPQLGVPMGASAIAVALLNEVDRSGLYGAHDLGMSTLPDGALNVNKLFVSFPEGRTGLFALLGGPAHALDTLAYAPPDTLLFNTTEFDVAGLLRYIREAVRNVGGDAAVQAFNQQLVASGSQVGFNVENVVNSLAGRFTFVGTLDPAQKLSLPAPANLQIDAPRFALVIDTKDNLLYSTLQALFTLQNVAGAETTSGEVKQFTLNLPPNPIWPLMPVVASDAGHCYIATQPAYLATVLAAYHSGGGLEHSQEFQALSRGLPTLGNDITFASAKVMQTYAQVLQSLPATTPQDATLRQFVASQLQSGGSCSVSVNEADGILCVGRSSEGAQAAFEAMALVPVAILAAIAIPNFTEAQGRSKVSRVMADERTMAIALESYYIDNNAYPATGNLYRLTTPVSYLTTLYPDPFAPAAQPFQYYSPAGTPSGWILWSYGPDGLADVTPQNVGQVYNPAQPMPGDALRVASYDPSNGTSSGGDVIRVKQ